MVHFDVIAFDADDTLWHNERLYADAQARFRKLLEHYHRPEWIDERLYRAEIGNLRHFGYGIKAFALSMIETAVELTEGRITGKDIQTIIDTAREMLEADVELLDHVTETLERLAGRYPLMVVTKGDLVDQETKLERSGLGPRFRHIEIVSDKTPASYESLLKRNGIKARRFLMVGNSLRSDVLPVLEIGGNAVHVPYAMTWAHEVVDAPPAGTARFHAIEHLGLLTGLLDRLEAGS